MEINTVETVTTSKDKLANIQEVANYLRVSVSTVRNLIQQGAFPYIPIGRSFRFDMNQVRQYVEDQVKFKPKSTEE
tara:strand:+ start:358 stop:585 length:228 start_codon:yes stop_codon:yes gene_type:complete